MRFSETPPEIRAARRGYIDNRWGQFSELSTAHGEEAIKYLLIVNTAALGASLGFIGAMPHLRAMFWPKLIILLFAFGIAIIGVYHSFRYHRTEWLFKNWRQDVSSYLGDGIEWNDLLDADEKRSKRFVVLEISIAYLALLCFYLGLAIAGFNFNDVAPRGSNERAQTTVSPEARSAGATTGSKPTAQEHPGSRPGAGKGGSP